MTPIPPSAAIALAILAPVTLSMFADITGSSKHNDLVSWDLTQMSRRVETTLFRGLKRKSSNVLP
jgi:hypothetical protein